MATNDDINKIAKEKTLQIIKANNERHIEELKTINIKDLPENILLVKNPELTKEWYYEKNLDLKPWQVTYASAKKVWWLCQNICEIGGCIHAYRSTIAHKSNGSGCIFCNPGGKNPLFCYHKSLAYLWPNVAKMWHPTKNIDLTPAEVTAKSHKSAWFRCPKTNCSMNCTHDFSALITNVVAAGNRNENMNGCPFCSGKSGEICKHLSLAFLFPKVASELHPTKNIDVKPETIFPRSGLLLWFKCEKTFECGCEHAYQTNVSEKTRPDDPTGCHHCSGHRFCEHLSLAGTNPELTSEWDFIHNSETPLDFSYGSGKIVYWICPNDPTHGYQCSIQERTCDGKSCPICHATTETKLNDFLTKLKNQKTKKMFNIKWTYYVDWCKSKITKRKLPFDFVIVELNIIIELDGGQHFRDVPYFGKTAEAEQRNDVYKAICAIENNHSVIRLSQIDVRLNKNDWQNKLTTLINQCNPKKPSIYYVDNGDLYYNHKKLFKQTMDNGGILPVSAQPNQSDNDNSSEDNSDTESIESVKPTKISAKKVTKPKASTKTKPIKEDSESDTESIESVKPTKISSKKVTKSKKLEAKQIKEDSNSDSDSDKPPKKVTKPKQSIKTTTEQKKVIKIKPKK